MNNRRRRLSMTKREEKFINSLHEKFIDLLDEIMVSDVIEHENKETMLNELKFMVNERIRDLQAEHFLE